MTTVASAKAQDGLTLYGARSPREAMGEVAQAFAAILDGRHDPERRTLERLMKPFPVEWGEQLHGF